MNQANLENGCFEQFVTHLERELKLNNLESPDETQMITVTRKQQIEGNKDNAGKINSDTHDVPTRNHGVLFHLITRTPWTALDQFKVDLI